jgi:hypothetical protein
MLGTLILVLVIVAVGARFGDNLRVKQAEIILRRLPEEEAAAYYEVLKKRVSRVRLLRAATLASLFVLIFVGRRRLFPSDTFADASKRRTHTTAEAQARAVEGLRRYAEREKLSPASFRLEKVGGDEIKAWVFDYRGPTGPRPSHLVRIFVGRDGKVETHRIFE